MNNQSLSTFPISTSRFPILMAIVCGVAVLLSGPAMCQEASDQSEVQALRKEVGELNSQIRTLNERVTTLERLLLTRFIETDPDNTGHLQTEVELAKEQLAHSERLFEKGYVSELQVQTDRYAVESAELKLELASMAADTAEFTSSIQLFEAQTTLNLATQRLQHSERLAAKGYITQAQVRSDQHDVEHARKHVELLKAELMRRPDSSDDEKTDDDKTDND